MSLLSLHFLNFAKMQHTHSIHKCSTFKFRFPTYCFSCFLLFCCCYAHRIYKSNIRFLYCFKIDFVLLSGNNTLLFPISCIVKLFGYFIFHSVFLRDTHLLRFRQKACGFFSKESLHIKKRTYTKM